MGTGIIMIRSVLEIAYSVRVGHSRLRVPTPARARRKQEFRAIVAILNREGVGSMLAFLCPKYAQTILLTSLFY
jgi:hypothetical protein